MVTLEELEEKIDRFLNHYGIDASSKFAVAKRLQDRYWDEWVNVEEIKEESAEDFTAFELPKEQHLTMNPGIALNQASPTPQLPNIKGDVPIQVI